MYEALFSPVKLKNMEVKNRLFMSPMSTNFANPDGSVSENIIYHYASRAKGGVGLIITEVTMVEPIYKYISHTLTLQDDSFIPGWKKLCDEVHKYGAKIAPQLLHPSYMALPMKGTPQLIGPSSVGPYYLPMPIREIKLEEIPYLIECFGKAALRAKTAGCDAVEIHAAHAHALIGGFLSPLYNKRTDEYGGDVDCRMRLLLEVISEVQKNCGADFPIIVRLSGDDYEIGGQDLNQACYIAKRLEQAGVAMLHISGGTTVHRASSITPPGMGQATHMKSAEEIKKCVSIPVSTVGRLNEGWIAEEALERGKADVIMMGRALLCDAEFPNKLRAGRKEEIRPCVGCLGCLSSVMLTDHVECAMCPSVTAENEETLPKAEQTKNVLVIGGGPAGMEAAYVAHKRGHHVVLVEKEDRLGGQMIAASYPIAKADMGKALKWMIWRIKNAGIEVILNKELTVEEIETTYAGYTIILANGAKPVMPQGLMGAKKTVAANDVILGRAFAGKNTVVIGGGSVGCECADFVAPLVNDMFPTNKKITILEMQQNVCLDDRSPSRSLLVQRLLKKGVNIQCNAKVTKVEETSVTYEQNGQEITIANVDCVILAVGSAPENKLAKELKTKNIAFTEIGDEKQVGKLKTAMASAYTVAKEI